MVKLCLRYTAVMRAAIVHYWLLNRRGGEKVLDALCRLLPDADIFTLFCDPATLSPKLQRHKITHVLSQSAAPRATAPCCR